MPQNIRNMPQNMRKMPKNMCSPCTSPGKRDISILKGKPKRSKLFTQTNPSLPRGWWRPADLQTNWSPRSTTLPTASKKSKSAATLGGGGGHRGLRCAILGAVGRQRRDRKEIGFLAKRRVRQLISIRTVQACHSGRRGKLKCSNQQ